MNYLTVLELIEKKDLDSIKKVSKLNPTKIQDFLEMCIVEDNFEAFNYIANNVNFDFSYDDSVLFNFSIELQKFKFSKIISKLKNIEVNNDNNWVLRHSINHKKKQAIDFLLLFDEISSNVNEEWLKQNTYENYDYVLDRLNIMQTKENIKKF